jgi:hypothetical protein
VKYQCFCEEFKANTLANLVSKINDYVEQSGVEVICHSMVKNTEDISLDDTPVYRYEALVTLARPVPEKSPSRDIDDLKREISEMTEGLEKESSG